MRKKALLGLALACAMLFSVGIAACGSDDGKGGIGETEWGATVEEFISESGVTAELQIFAAHYRDFTYADGKFTAPEIAATGGFTCKNIVITIENDKIVKVEYELRTPSKETPDRIITIDKNGITKTDVPKPSDNAPMDEDEWKEQAAVFSTTSNYTLSRVRVATGEYVAAMKLDGTTYYETWEGRERIWDIENSKYVVYNKYADSSEWTKDDTTEDRYDSAIFDPSTMVTVAAAAIESNFAALAFNAGVYTTAEIEVEYFSYPFTLRDVEITVSGGKIVRVICTLVGGYDEEGDERITVDHVGSTEIAFPATYTDNTHSGDDATGTETNEKMWEVGLSSADNFTLINTVTLPGIGTMTMTYKMDGNECEQITSDGTRFVGVKEGEGFVEYDYHADDDSWHKVKETSGAQFTYETNLSYLAQLAQQFSFFTFADGKYTCDGLKIIYMDAPAEIREIEVVFVEDEPVSIKFMMTNNGITASYEFSAFGKTEVEVPTENIVDDTQQGGGGGTGSVVLAKDTDFDELVSDTVTEDQWRAALSDSSFDNSTIEWYSVVDVQDSHTAYRKCKTEGGNKYVSGYVEGEYANYVTYEDGNMYMYSQSGDGEYTRSELEKERWDLYIAYTLICPEFRECYSQFTYNKDTGAYEYHGAGIESNAPMEPDPDWTMTYVNIQIKFADGKLAYIACDRIVDDEDTDHYTFKCYDYGKTDFELPADFSDVGTGGEGGGTGGEGGSQGGTGNGETNAQQWANGFGSNNFTVSVEATGDSAPVNSILAKFDGDAIDYTQDGMNMIFAKENGHYYMYMKMGGSWMKQSAEDTVGMVAFYQGLPALFTEDFSEFTYQDGKYTCASSTKTLSDTDYEFTDIEVVFGSKGEIVSFQCTTLMNGVTFVFHYSAFGTTEVEVPTVS